MLVTRSHTPRRLVAAGLLMTMMLIAHPAHAFSPAVPRALARAALAGGAPAGDAARLLGDAAESAVDARVAAEEAAPEASAASHVWYVLASSDAAIAYGSAPMALATAHLALTSAFASGDAAAIARATAALAIAAADLADPFHTAEPSRSGPTGAWARFSDLVDPADLLLSETAAPVSPVQDAESAGRSLAARSAAVRDSAEGLARSGSNAELAPLRRARIDDAFQLMGLLVARARQSAGTTAVDLIERRARLASVMPNPERGHALLSFRSVAAGKARVRVTGVNGRRVTDFEQPVAAGAVVIALDANLPPGLAPGAYFARVTAPGVDTVARFVHLAP